MSKITPNQADWIFITLAWIDLALGFFFLTEEGSWGWFWFMAIVAVFFYVPVFLNMYLTSKKREKKK